MQPARFLFDRFAADGTFTGDRNLVHRSTPNRKSGTALFLPLPNPPRQQCFGSFFLQNFFHSGRVFWLIEIPSYYLEGIIIYINFLFSTEKKGRKKFVPFRLSSIFVNRDFVRFDDEICVRDLGSSRWNQLGCCSRRGATGRRVKKRFVSSSYLPFLLRYRRFLRFVTWPREHSSSSSCRNLSFPSAVNRFSSSSS